MAKKKSKRKKGSASSKPKPSKVESDVSDSARPSVEDGGATAAAPLSKGRRWAHVGVAALGGALQCLGFAGWSLWPFALFCFVPMMWVLDQEKGASTKRVLALGLVHGAVGYTGGYYWLVKMLESFSGYEGMVNWLFASVFFVYQGGQQMLIYWLYQRARKRGASPTLAAVPALLTMELGYPVLFPAFLATGFHNATWLIQVADLGGPMLLSAAVMLFNGAVYEVLAWRFGSAGKGDTGRGPFPKRVAITALLTSLFVVGYGAYRVNEVDARAAEAETARVGMVQVNMGIFAKREEPFEGHRRHLQQSAQLLQDEEDLDLLVWPESAYTFFVPEGMTNLRRRVLGNVDVPTLFGGLARRTVDGESKHYNTAYLTDASGDIVGTYDKTYLLAFGEYMPLADIFPIIYEWSPNSGRFTAGNHVRPLLLDNLRISTLICYEDVLPGFTRHAVHEANPNLFVNITNDAWFGDTHEPWIHLALAKFRSVEHHRAMARSTNSGVTAFVDPAGRALETIPFGERDEIVADLPLMQQATLYQYVGDWPGCVGLLAMIYLGFTRKKRGGT